MAWSKSTRITIMLTIDAAFFVLELGVGLLVGSLALMADAFHMVSKIGDIGGYKGEIDFCAAE
jgi:zinc transporter 1